jgi:hypothetical protein
MPELKDVSDSSDDEETKQCDGMHTWDDSDAEELIQDDGCDAYTTTVTCATLVNAAGADEGVETDLYDSGASRHMSPYRHRFENYVSIAPKSITAADKRLFQAIGKGDLRIKIPNGKTTTSMLLKDVLYSPDLGLTLISISKITDANYATLFRGEVCRIFDKGKKLVGEVPKRNGLYRVEHSVGRGGETAGMVKETVSIEELHRRMGHIAPEAAKRMVKDQAVEGIDLDPSSEIKSCASCQYAKMTRKPIQRTRVEPRASKFGEEIHSDLWGPSPVQTPGKRSYYVSFTDDYTRWVYLKLLRTKDECFEAYKGFEAMARTQHRIGAIKKLRTDRGGEYLGSDFTTHLNSQGTQRILTTHDTPEYNGVSEQGNRRNLEHTRAMLHSSGLPKFLWGEAVLHSVWLRNRTPTRALPAGKTPYEMLHGKKPNLNGLREWGSKVWVHDTSGSKLDGRSRIGHWVGFDEPSNAHRITGQTSALSPSKGASSSTMGTFWYPEVFCPRGRRDLTSRTPPKYQIRRTKPLTMLEAQVHHPLRHQQLPIIFHSPTILLAVISIARQRNRPQDELKGSESPQTMSSDFRKVMESQMDAPVSQEFLLACKRSGTPKQVLG